MTEVSQEEEDLQAAEEVRSLPTCIALNPTIATCPILHECISLYDDVLSYFLSDAHQNTDDQHGCHGD